MAHKPNINKKALAGISGIVGLAAFGAFTFSIGTAVGPTNTSAATFDHSQCQYPYRWSNPADGCDNSDPAVPECVKATTQQEEQECIANFTKSQKDQTPPDPERPSYDASGNKYDAYGNLIEAAPKQPSKPANTCGGN